MNKSAITDHVAKENHVINWSGAKVLEREGHRKTRQVKESIWIRKEPTCMNRDGGAYSLPTAYNHLLVTCSISHDHQPDEAHRWRAKRRNCVIEYCFSISSSAVAKRPRDASCLCH